MKLKDYIKTHKTFVDEDLTYQAKTKKYIKLTDVDNVVEKIKDVDIDEDFVINIIDIFNQIGIYDVPRDYSILIGIAEKSYGSNVNIQTYNNYFWRWLYNTGFTDNGKYYANPAEYCISLILCRKSNTKNRILNTYSWLDTFELWFEINETLFNHIKVHHPELINKTLRFNI